MKQVNRFSVMAVIISALTLAGCADDVYDPSKGIQTEPKENPLGADFSAPNGFDWSMINSVKLNVEVNDEFNGTYEYLVEVFTANPLANENLSPITFGPANKNKNYAAEINIPKAVKSIFIRQTDPKQRKEIYEYAVPENGTTLNCKLYYVAPATRAMSRAAQSVGTSGWDKIPAVSYTEESYNIPSESANLEWGQLPGGSVYVIKAGVTYKGAINSYGATNATVYVQGTWESPNTPQGINIIVLNGGKITDSSNAFMVSDKSSLTIQTGGLVECGDFKTTTGVTVKNFGTLKVKNSININYNTLLFNAKDAEIESKGSFKLTDAKLYNQGKIVIDQNLNTNNGSASIIANHDNATIKVKELNGGATIVNNGLIELDACKNGQIGVLYNNCTLIAKKEFEFRNLVLNKGSITGGRANPTDTEWQPVPLVTSLTDAKLTLINGSMIKATTFKVQSGNVEFEATNQGGNTDKSMIKAEKEIHFAEPTHASLIGYNLVVEGKMTGTNEWNQLKKNESVNTGYNESKYTIETCGGLFNEGDEGENPSNPQFPIEIEDSQIYTFAFEDNWPVYGDFDMNDLILTASDKKLKVKNGIVESLKMSLELRAVGATKNLAVGIRFTKLPQDIQLDEFIINSKSDAFESGQSAPTCILFTNAHETIWRAPYTDTEKRINTQKDGPFQKNPKKYTVNMKIPASAKVKPENFNINNIDIFIITAPATAQKKRTEVHVAGFAPTDLGDTQSFKQGNDNSSVEEGRFYLSKENLAWGVVIPQNFAWPLETIKITTAYGKFQSWITSGGENDKDWYTKYNSENIYPIDKLTPLN